MNQHRHKKLAYWGLILFVIIKIATGLFWLSLPSPVLADEISATQILRLTNELRQEKKLELLKANASLTQAAYNKALDIFTNGYFAHQSPQGKKFSGFIKEAGYEYFLVGENLALNFSDSQAVIAAWEKSPAHLANILNPGYQEIGIAVLSGKYLGQTTTVVVQMFGTKAVAGQTEINPQALLNPSLPEATPYFWNDFWQSISKYSGYYILLVMIIIFLLELEHYLRHEKKLKNKQ